MFHGSLFEGASAGDDGSLRAAMSILLVSAVIHALRWSGSFASSLSFPLAILVGWEVQCEIWLVRLPLS